jgi:hypothetical protein
MAGVLLQDIAQCVLNLGKDALWTVLQLLLWLLLLLLLLLVLVLVLLLLLVVDGDLGCGGRIYGRIVRVFGRRWRVLRRHLGLCVDVAVARRRPRRVVSLMH